MKTRSGRFSLVSRSRNLFLLLIAIPAILCCILLWNNSMNRAITQQENAALSLAQSYTRHVENEASRAEGVVRLLSVDSSIHELMSPASLPSGKMISLLNGEVRIAIATSTAFLADLGASFSVYSVNMEIPEQWFSFFRMDRLDLDEAYASFLRKNVNFAWVGRTVMYPEVTSYIPQNTTVIACYCRILTGVNREIGIVKCGISPEQLLSAVVPDSEKDAIYLLDNAGTVWMKGSTDIEAPVSGGFPGTTWKGNTLYAYELIESLDMTLCLCRDEGSILREARLSALLLILLVVCVTALMLFIMLSLHYSLLSGLKDAAVLAERLEPGDFSVRFQPHHNDEVGQLLNYCNMLLDNMETTARSMLENQQNLQKAQLRALQYQINPHFLFNTLSWIQMMSESGKDDSGQISNTVAQLSEYLRYNMDMSPMSDLGQERENMECYIAIMRMRRDAEIILETEWDETLDNMPVMRFLFQPLIENAVKHGLTAGKQLHILVCVQKEGSRVNARVANDGAAIPAAQLEMLRQILDAPNNSDSHIGLANVVSRLRLMYGQDAGIVVSSDSSQTYFDIVFDTDAAGEKEK